MAVTGTYTKASGYYTLKLEVTETATSTANNTSTLSWKLTLLTGSTYFSGVRVGYTVKIDGTTVGSLNYTNATAKNMNKNDSWEMASGTTTVTHGADGSKTIAAGAITAVLNTQTGNIVPNISLASGSALELTPIPRASTIAISGSSTLMGTARTITITRASSSFTHTLTYAYGSASGTIATKTSSTSVSFTPPTSLAAQVESGTIRKSGTITCTTYNGNTAIGTDTISFVAQIPASTATTSASDNHMGKTRSFTISRAASNLTHTLTYVFGSGSGTITTKTTSTSVSWTVPTSLAQYVATNNASASGTVTITTFNGEAQVGTSTVSFTAAIPASTMTVKTARMGVSTPFEITRAASQLSHKITYTFSAASGYAAGSSSATVSNTSLTWTPPYSLANQLNITGGVKSGTITYTLTTYNGTASCGTNTYTATLKAPTASLNVPSSFVMGTSSNIQAIDQDSNFAHTIVAQYSSTTETFANKTTATNVPGNFTIATWAPLIPTAKTLTVTIKQTVYSSSGSNTVVAYNEYTATVSVPSTAPTATITPSVVTSLASPFNTVYIQNNSQVKVAVALSSPTGAYLDKASMTIDGVTKNYSVSANVTSWSGNVTSNLLQTSGSRTITVKVTDKRGYTGTYTTTISVVAYSNPTISNATGETKVIIERSNSSGTADPAGSYLHLKFIRKISAITNNTGYVSYKVGSGTATTISTSTTGSVTINQTLNLGWSEHNTYKVTVRIWDSVGYEVTRTVTIPSLNVTLDLREGGLGVGIGMFSQGNNRFDVAWNSYFAGDLSAVRYISNMQASSGGYSFYRVTPRWNYADILGGTTDSFPANNYLEAWLKKVAETYPTVTATTFIGNAVPSGFGFIACYIVNNADVSGGLPNQSSGIYVAYNTLSSNNRGAIVRFGTDNYTFWYNVILSDDVDTSSVTYYTNSYIDSTNAAKLHLRKSGKVVTMETSGEVTLLNNTGSTTWTKIGTIPTAFAPAEQTRIYVPLRSSTYYGVGIGVNTDGEVQMYKNNTSSNTLHFTMTWIIA